MKIGAWKHFFCRKQTGTDPAPSRAPILHVLAPLLASRDPVGIQSGSSRDPVGSSRAPLSGSSQNRKKLHFCRVLARFKVILAASRQVQKRCEKFQNWCPTGSRLDPDQVPTGQKWCQKMQNWCATASQLNPRIGKKPSPTTFAPIFPCPDVPLPLFSLSAHQPCTDPPLPAPKRY